MWILRGGLAVSLYALVNLGVRNGKHAVYEIRERFVFRHILSVPKVSFCCLVLFPFFEKLHRLPISYKVFMPFSRFTLRRVNALSHPLGPK